MRLWIVGFSLGVLWLQTQPTLPSSLCQTLLALLGALLLILVRRLPEVHRARYIARLFAGAALGVFWAALIASRALEEELAPALEGQNLILTGVIDSLPDVVPQGVRFIVRVESAVHAESLSAGAPSVIGVPKRILLSWYAPRGASFSFSPTPAMAAMPKPGQRWRWLVRLQRPHGNLNPYGFDYEAYLLEQGVRATGYVRETSPRASTSSNNLVLNVLISDYVPSFNALVERSRAALRQHIQDALPKAPYVGVITALVMGDQRGVSAEDWLTYTRTGIGHLISISGLHITMLAGLAAGLAGWLWRRSFFTSASLPLRLPAQKFAALIGMLTALVYVLLAGAGVPALRTLCMLTVVGIALFQGRIMAVSHVLCLALLAALLLDPWAVLAPGFWLSFGAVGVILYASSGRGTEQLTGHTARWKAMLAGATQLQYAISIGLVPLTLLLFGQVSLVSPLANAVAIPLVSFVITPLALLGSILPLPLASLVLGTAHAVMAGLTIVLEWLAALPAATWSTPVPSLWIFGCACLGLIWLLAPRGWPHRWLGLPAMLPLLCNVPSHPAHGSFWVTAFDVGQGMAVLIETADHRLLYDTGPAYTPETDGAGRVILPYLRGRGISALDAVVITHNDADHSGGARTLFKSIKVGWSSSSLDEASPIRLVAPAHRPCLAGQTWEWDGIRFEMLHPTESELLNERKPNAKSCTLKISNANRAVLLAGDIEASQEAALRLRGVDLRADVLLAPHHGSGTSSTLPFLQAVAPRIALFQVGYRNRYRHPKDEVWQRYGSLGITRLRTDRDGALILRIGSEIEQQTWRQSDARYWRQIE